MIKGTDDYSRHPPEIGKRDPYCRPCRAEYGREHYEKNRQRYIDQAKKRTEKVLAERMQFLLEHFSSHPCVDCGETDVAVLEFDHLGEKAFNVSSGVRDRGEEAFYEEIAKCEVVCANCHRRRTARRGGFFRTRWNARDN